jgi:hypothetical protein
VHPVSEHAFGQFGILPSGAHEVAERAKNACPEVIANIQQRRGGWCQAYPIALQLLEGRPPRRHLRQGFFRLPALGAIQGLMLASLRHSMPRPFGRGGCTPGFVRQKAGALDGAIAASFNPSQLLLETGAARVCLRCPVTK